MFRRTLILGAATVFAVTASLAATGRAGAQQIPPPTPDLTGLCLPPTLCSVPGIISDAAVFTGQAIITSDSDNVGQAGETNGVDLLGGTGGFNYTTQVLLVGAAVCVSDPAVDAGDPGPGVEVGVSAAGAALVGGGCSVAVTSGTFANLVCGTGSATGTGTITGPDGTTTGLFAISFYGTIGIVTGSNGGENIYGVVQLAPPASANLPDAPNGTDIDCTRGFTATGAIVAFENTSS